MSTNKTEAIAKKEQAESQKIKIFHKVTKREFVPLLIIFSWIAVWNIIYQVIHHSYPELPVVSWAFFISVTVFFMQEKLGFKQKFFHTLVGGAVGLVLAAAIPLGCTMLVKKGLPAVVAVCIFVVAGIGLLLLLSHSLPMFFNNVGFCYFIIALIDSKTAVENLPKYLLSLLLGSLILNLGSIMLLKLYSSHMAKKAAKK